MATQSDQVFNLVCRFPGLDDDEIARLLKISPRQTVNIICRQLADKGRIRRAKGPKGKIANYPVVTGSRKVEVGITKTGVIEPDIEGEILPTPSRPPLTAQQLLQSGFQQSAQWKLNSNGSLEADRELPRDKGVYAFVKSDVAMYVGVASMGLRKRLYFYEKPGATQKTSQRLSAILKEEIAKGASISIYTANPPDQNWNGLPVSGVAGLEIGLIEAFHLPWNIRGAR